MAGRKPKLVADEKTLRQIEQLASIQCTHDEAAAVLSVSRTTFHAFLYGNKEALDAWENGKGAGKASLRRQMWKSASGGNVTAQIWLSKQHLGMSDKTEERLTADHTHTVINKDELLDKAQQLQKQFWKGAQTDGKRTTEKST
jgi:hypothetical protein